MQAAPAGLSVQHRIVPEAKQRMHGCTLRCCRHHMMHAQHTCVRIAHTQLSTGHSSTTIVFLQTSMQPAGRMPLPAVTTYLHAQPIAGKRSAQLP